MNLHAILIVILAGSTTVVPAQAPARDAAPPVREVLRKLESKAAKPNEVTVVLPAAGQPEPTKPESTTPPQKPAAPPAAKPAGSNKAPDGIELLVKPAPPDDASKDRKAGVSPQGLAIRVEPVQPGTGTIDPAQVSLSAPFPAKPLGSAPAGWQFKRLPDVTPLTREVELAPGQKVTLSIHPDVLVPADNGTEVFSVMDPGYDPALGYRQTGTVGTILANSMRQLDDDAKALGAAIDQLQQALVSLPKPTLPQPAEPEAPGADTPAAPESSTTTPPANP